ncbi:MAG: response regulator transcription factor [Actinomycetota bacterium]|nr:response regulator transcription factor [Actinomycetota bacterium]
MASLLLVEDDAEILEQLARRLSREGFGIVTASTAAAALDSLADRDIELVVLDVGLPDFSGFELCRRLRRAHPALPVVMLTARSDELDVLTGFDAGADDYIVKPFRMAELVARVRARLRGVDPVGMTDIDGLHLDARTRLVTVAGEDLELSPKEFDVLAVLIRGHGAVVTRAQLMDKIWGEDWFGSTRTLDVHMTWLRSKLADAGWSGRIATVRGVGYRLEA